jgi:glycosyltransferase involved in cell wall biosynthesis
MRILVVSQYFWPESFRINEVVSSLVARGHQVDVLTAKPNYPEGTLHEGYSAWRCERCDWRGAAVHRVPIVPRGKKNALRLALNYLSFVLSAASLGTWMLRSSRPEVIFVYAPSPLLQALPALFIGWLKRCRVVLNVQDLWPESLEATGYISSRQAIRLVAQVVRFIYRHTDMILISSRSFRDSIARFAPPAEIIYYPNSVDSYFCDPTAGVKIDIPALNDGFSVVFAGNVGSAQAVHVITSAAEELQNNCPEAHLVVLGSGSELDWMQGQKDEKQLSNLILAGRFPVDAMPYMLSRASVLLVTLANHPIFAATVPNKIQAYLAVGRPIIACLDGEGGRIIEESGAGIAVPAEDSVGLARAIASLYSASQLERDEMGARGKSYFHANFDHEALVSDLIGHLERAIGIEK